MHFSSAGIGRRKLWLYRALSGQGACNQGGLYACQELLAVVLPAAAYPEGWRGCDVHRPPAQGVVHADVPRRHFAAQVHDLSVDCGLVLRLVVRPAAQRVRREHHHGAVLLWDRQLGVRDLFALEDDLRVNHIARSARLAIRKGLLLTTGLGN